MKQFVLFLVLASVFVVGCANQQALIPEGKDPDQLVAAIARKGRSDSSVEPEPPGSYFLSDCVKTGAKVSKTSGVILLVLLYAAARAPIVGDHVTEELHRIWYED